LHYINAGHVPPAVIRPAGGIAKLSEGGMVVGAFPDPRYTRGYIQLREGDIVAGYTDGITDAMDAHGNQYGLESLVNAVRRTSSAPAERIVHTVLEEVDRFSRESPHDDDRVMLILKVL
jgi:phosphoserine phosphatase RsbU/P